MRGNTTACIRTYEAAEDEKHVSTGESTRCGTCESIASTDLNDSSRCSDVLDFGSEPESGKTTVMIRNVPCRYTRDDLVREVSELGYRFDLLCLPHASRSYGNLGYAFVNFTTSASAALFMESFTGRQWKITKSRKLAEVVYAQLQGFDANVAKVSSHKFKKAKLRPYIELSPVRE